MTSERTEHRATDHALKEVFDYISPGTNEGISFSLSRLTDDLFTDSFLAGGDISLFTPSGERGSIRSQDSQGSVLSSSGAAPSQFPIALTIDLSTGNGSGSSLSVNVRRDAHHRGINDLEGESGERRTCRRRARMELEQRLGLLPPASRRSEP